jgi:HSP20 family protein
MSYQTLQASWFNQSSWFDPASPLDATGGLLSAMRKEIDHIFDEFDGSPSGRVGHCAAPRMNVSETDNAIEVDAELPGVEEKDVEVSLNDGVLTIKGEKRMERGGQHKDYFRQECSYGRFARSITLPFAPDARTVKTLFGRGVLKITLPKSADAKQHSVRISIKALA